MSAPGLVVGAKVRNGAGKVLWEVERIGTHTIRARSAKGQRRNLNPKYVRVVEPVPGMETMEVRASGHVEVDGKPVRWSDAYYRTVVDWPPWIIGGMTAPQPSSFAVRVRGGNNPCLVVEADGPCDYPAMISTRDNAQALALAIIELSKYLPE